jgi:CRISPR-associated RAMP protein (TIGR02581 family)
MFKTLQNLATIKAHLSPDGPLLVRAQSVGIDPGIADMEFQRTRRNGESTVFLAGSGLKGVLRSHCERLLRSAGRFACDPTQIHEEATCGRHDKKDDSRRDPTHRDPTAYPHDNHCAACFTFGSLKMAGRFRVADAYPVPSQWEAANRTEVRTGVGIERKSQAAASRAGVLYDTEVVVGGAFELRIGGENFSLWQLGLVLTALEDLSAGLVRVGGCKARGMGTVRLDEWSVDLAFTDTQTGKLNGAAAAIDSLDHKYGLAARDTLDVPPGGEAGSRGLFRQVSFRGDAVAGLAAALRDGPLRKYLPGGNR